MIRSIVGNIEAVVEAEELQNHTGEKVIFTVSWC